MYTFKTKSTISIIIFILLIFILAVPAIAEVISSSVTITPNETTLFPGEQYTATLKLNCLYNLPVYYLPVEYSSISVEPVTPNPNIDISYTGIPELVEDTKILDVNASIIFEVDDDIVPGSYIIEMKGSADFTYYYYFATTKTCDLGTGSFKINVGTPIEIDVYPNTFPNLINLKSKGVLPVAILTTSDFDASDVDPSTLSLNDEALVPLRWNMEDVDRDGDIDMIMHYEMSSVSELINSGDETIKLMGETYDGRIVRGIDDILTKTKK